MMRSLKSILFEEPESGSDAIYGKYLFDTQRNDIPEKEKEKDTDEELDLNNAFDYYINRNEKEKLSAAAPKLLKLIQNGKYLPLLDPGNRKVYRLLMAFGDSYANKFLPDISKIKENEVVTLGPGKHSNIHSNISGWTTDTSWMLQYDPGEKNFDNSYYILLHANTSNNKGKFFGNPDRLSATYGNGEEFETIGYGKINYEKAVVVKKLSKELVDMLPEDEQKSHTFNPLLVLLNHNQTLKEEPESKSDPDAIYGKYLFDTHRKNIPPEELETETPQEENLYRQMDAYFDSSVKNGLDQMAPTLLDLVQKGKYQPLLDPGDKKVYRYIIVTGDSEAEKIIPGISKIKSGEVHKEEGGELRPNSGKISGWSTKKSSLISVGTRQHTKENYHMYFQANISDNPNKFFGSPGNLGALFNKKDEWETIGYGPIQYSQALVLKISKKTKQTYPNDRAIMIDNLPLLSEKPKT